MSYEYKRIKDRANSVQEVRSGGEVDLSGYVTKETGNANQITFSDGQTFQAKLDAGTLKGDKGDKGDVGPQGPQGIQGPAGTTTASGVSITDAGNYFTATDVEDESQLQLTPDFIKLISDQIIIDTKKLEINGTININDRAFYVGETGRTEIGGRTGQVIDNYDRAQLDINSYGTLYSVAKTVAGLYAKLSEGYLQLTSNTQTTKITSAGVDTTSDIRLKENISLIDKRYEKLMFDISPIQYNMKDDGENITKRKNIGFSAQQVQSLMEDYNISYDEFSGLNKDKDGIYSLNYSQFIPLNTYLIQQLNKKIIMLEERISQLENGKEE